MIGSGTLEFLRPLWLLLLPLAPLCSLLILIRADHGWQRYIPPHWVAYLQRGRAGGRRWVAVLHALCAGLFLALTTLALAGPAWQLAPGTVAHQRHAMILMLDLSPSMTATDLLPNRYTRARLKLVDLLRARVDGETGLIAYAGAAHRVAPLTDDPQVIETLVQTLSPDLMPMAGSYPEAAVDLALSMLGQQRYASADLVLVTDGVNAAAVTQILSQLPPTVRLSVLAVATTAPVRVPLPDGDYLRDNDGNLTLVTTDAALLQQLALGGRGVFHWLTDDNRDIDSVQAQAAQQPVFADTVIGAASMATGSAHFDQKEDGGFWLLLLVLPLALYAFRRQVLWSASIVFLLSASLTVLPGPVRATSATPAATAVAGATDGIDVAEVMAAPPDDADTVTTGFSVSRFLSEHLHPSLLSAYQRMTGTLAQDRNRRALALLQQHQPVAAAEMFEDRYWRALAWYRAGDYATAAALIATHIDMAAEESRALTDDVFYNYGNALALDGEYALALEAYALALQLSPGDADARGNQALVQTLLPDSAQQDEPQGGAAASNSGETPATTDTEAAAADTGREDTGAHQSSGSAIGGGDTLDQFALQGEAESSMPLELDADAESDAQPDAETPAEASALQPPDDSASDTDSELTSPAGEASSQSSDAGGEHGDPEMESGQSNVLNPYAEQWLSNLPNDPGGYLRRKFRYQAAGTQTSATVSAVPQFIRPPEHDRHSDLAQGGRL